jgi:peptidoglycan/xylan/chitin deacetylase (PgdA/CDA1 family)
MPRTRRLRPAVCRALPLLLACTAAVATAGSGAHAASATTGCPTPEAGIIRSAPGAGKTVALTFDDGPSRFTPQILAILRRKNVRATFFNTGAHASRRPRLTAEVAGEGHLLGNHTWDHRYPSQLARGWSRAYLAGQMARTNRVEEKASGRPTCFLRPPGGFVTPALVPTARAHHLSVVMWSVDTGDWRQPALTSELFTGAIVRAAAAGLTQAHPVVLMHDGKASHEPEAQVHRNRSNDVAALPRIIDLYRRHGYRFVDLLGRSGLPPAPTTLRVAGGKARVTRGRRAVAVEGKLSAVTGPLRHQQVRWYTRRPGAGRWRLGGAVTTGRTGVARVFVTPLEPAEYTLRFAGAPGLRPARARVTRTIYPSTGTTADTTGDTTTETTAETTTETTAETTTETTAETTGVAPVG